MDISNTNNPVSFVPAARRQDTPENKEETAMEFERFFAQHMVQEMTKGLFEHEGNGVVGNSGNFYRDFITGTLADELAAQRRLGMADLIIKHWDQQGLFQEQTNETDNGTAS